MGHRVVIPAGKIFSLMAAFLVTLGLAGWSARGGQDEPIDFEKARHLRRDAQGSALGEEERAFLERAKAAFRRRAAALKGFATVPKDHLGLVPLTDLRARLATRARTAACTAGAGMTPRGPPAVGHVGGPGDPATRRRGPTVARWQGRADLARDVEHHPGVPGLHEAGRTGPRQVAFAVLVDGVRAAWWRRPGRNPRR